MSRYNLKPYQSVYRDPQSVQINTLLRQRFQQAFNADDALAGAVDQMNAAEFEGDQALKMELEQNTRGQLQDRAGRGDYETMMLDVAKSARNFEQQYAPINANYQKYQNYKKGLDEAYKEGNINAFTYRRSLDASKYNYEGLQKNEDGSIDDGSYFSGYNYVNDVDIQAKMSELMKDHAVKKYGKDVQVISEDGNYYVTDGFSRETIPDTEVAMVFNNLIAQPDVAAYLNQKAELSTFDMTDEDIRSSLTRKLYGDDDPESEDKGLIGLRDKAIAAGEDELAADYDAMIKETQGLLQNAGVETEDEMIAKRRNYIKGSVLQSEAKRELDVSITRFAFDNREINKAIEYSDKWKADYGKFLDIYQPDILKRTDISEISNPGGNNPSAINDYINGQLQIEVNEVNAFNTLYADVLKGRKVTAEDILSGNVPDELKEGNVYQTHRDKIILSRTQRYLQNNLLEKADKEAGSEFKEEFLTSNLDRNAFTGQDLLEKAREVTGNSNLTLIELGSIMSDAAELTSYSTRRSEAISFAAGDTKTEEELNKLRKSRDIKNQIYDALNISNFQQAGITNSFRDLTDKYTDGVEDWLEKNAKINVGDWTANNFPALDNPAKIAEVTAYVKQYFTGNNKGGGAGKPLDPTFKIFYDGKKQEGTGTVASFLEDMEWKSKDVKVVDVMFDQTPYMGEPTLQLTVKGEEGESGVIILPYSNIQNDQMDQYFQLPGFRLQQELMMHKQARADNATIGLYDKKTGALANQITVTFDTDRGDVALIDGNYYRLGSKEFLKMMDTNAANFEFRTITY